MRRVRRKRKTVSVPGFCNLALPGVRVEAKSWETTSPVWVGTEPERVLDGDPSTFWASFSPEFPKDIGLEFDRPIRIRGLTISYMGWKECYVPDACRQEVQWWDGHAWAGFKCRPAKIADAPATWEFRFRPVRMSRIRVLIRGSGPLVPCVARLEVASPDLDRGPRGLVWSAADRAAQMHRFSALNDGQYTSAIPIRFVEAVGIEWKRPVRINAVLVRYYRSGFVEEETVPAISEQVLEVQNGRRWTAVACLAALDNSRGNALAPQVRTGYVTAAFSFDSIRARRIRVRFTGPRQRSAVCEIEACCSTRMKGYVTALVEKQTAGALSRVRPQKIDPLADFPFLLSGEGGSRVDLARMGRLDPHIARACSFEQGSSCAKGHEPQNICDGDTGTWWCPADSSLPVDIGIEWLNCLMLGKVVFTYRFSDGKKYQPALDGQDLQAWDGERWVSLDDEVERDESRTAEGFTIWTHNFLPCSTSRIRLVIRETDRSCTDTDRVNVIAMEAYEEVPRAHREWLSGPRSDPLGRYFLSCGEEPSYEAMAGATVSMVGRASMGVPGSGMESGVAWDGTILSSWPAGARLPMAMRLTGFAFGENASLHSIDRRAIRRELLDGYLPGVRFVHHSEGLVYEQTAFSFSPSGPGEAVTLVRITARNPGSVARKTRVAVVLGWFQRFSSQFLPVPCASDRGRRMVTDAEGNILLAYSRDGVFRDGLEKVVTWTMTLEPGGSRTVEIRLPLGKTSAEEAESLWRFSFDTCLETFRKQYADDLSSGMRIVTPEDRVNRACRYFLAQIPLAVRNGFLPYGLFPSRYAMTAFGLEEGWPMTALAEFGRFGMAMECLAATYLTERHLVPGTYDHALRNGLAAMYARDIYVITRDRAWLARIMPVLLRCAEWTMDARRKTTTEEGIHAGLLPKACYGGDIHEPAYSLYSNAVCWRGLRDTGLLLKELGESRRSGELLKEAEDFLTRLLPAVRDVRFKAIKPSSFDLRLYWHRPYPYTPTHYQLFMPGSFLSLGLLSREETSESMEFLEQNGKLFCGIPLLYSGMMIEPGSGQPPEYLICTDPVYMLAYFLELLKRDRSDRFLLAFYGLLAYGMDRDVFACPEVVDICLTEGERNWCIRAEGRSTDEWCRTSDPLTATPGVFLIVLKKMLVMEEEDESGQPTGVLWLNRMTPRRWLEHGKRIEVENAPTRFGNVSFRIESCVDEGNIRVEVTLPESGDLKEIRLRLRHPEKKPIRAVSVDGRELSSFDAGTGTVFLPLSPGNIAVLVRY